MSLILNNVAAAATFLSRFLDSILRARLWRRYECLITDLRMNIDKSTDQAIEIVSRANASMYNSARFHLASKLPRTHVVAKLYRRPRPAPSTCLTVSSYLDRSSELVETTDNVNSSR